MLNGAGKTLKELTINFGSFSLSLHSYLRYFAVLRRRNYVTPTSYLELIKTFKSLLERKRFQILTLKTRYHKGLEKLDFASSQVK